MTAIAETPDRKPRTADVNGPLWGARSADWSTLTEPLMAPVYRAAFERARLGDGDEYLDVGCGSGYAAQMAAALGARVHGVDAAEKLLEIARRRVPDGRFDVGDLEALPYEAARFDLVTGFNSFQYAGNPAVALAEARRVTRPGGTVLVTTWGRPEGMEAAQIVAALRPLLPAPPAGAPGPFALSDEATLRAFVNESGLVAGELFDTDAPWHFPSMEIAVRAVGAAGVAVRAEQLVGRDRVDAAFAAALAPFRCDDGSIRVGATFRCLLARA